MKQIKYSVVTNDGKCLGSYMSQEAAEEAALDLSYTTGEEYFVTEVYPKTRLGAIMGTKINNWIVEHGDDPLMK